MKTIEKIRQKIEELYDGEAPAHGQQCDFEDGYFTGIATISNFLDTLSEEPDKSLEEAAIDFAQQRFPEDEQAYARRCARKGFIAGAKWQKEQMLKGAKDGYVSAIIIHNNGDEEHYAVTYPNGKRPHSITDKVKIIIL